MIDHSCRPRRSGGLVHVLAALAALAALVVSTPAALLAAPGAPALPEGMRFVTSVEGITEYGLDNGLRILLFPDNSKESATVNVTYLVGSRHEGYGETGMAHLLEHLVFKGTPNHPNIPDELTTHGTRPNGSTWWDRTNYFETFVATEENLAWALDLEADRMVNSYIAKKDLDSEMTVVRNEFEMDENSPSGVLFERIMSTAYLWHNYGKSTIGARADLENVPIERLQAFYRNWYQPDNAVLIVAGRFDEAKTLGLIKKTFGKIPRPKRTIQKTYTTDPTQDGERSVTLRRVGDTQIVAAAYHIPPGTHPDYAPLDVLAFVLGDTPSGRLHKALVEPKKATSVSADAWQMCEPGVLFVQADLRLESSLDEARDVFLRTIEEAAATPVSVADVDRAREDRLKGWERTMRNSERAAIQLSEWMALGDWRLMFLYRDALAKVTPEDVQRVAAAYLKPSNRTLGLFVPTKDPDRATIPAAPQIAGLVENYKGGEALASGEEFDPTPEIIESRAIRSTLPNGMKVVLVPKDTRGDQVVVSIGLHFGDEKSLWGKARAAELAGAMLMHGTKTRTRQEIADEADRLRAQLTVRGDATGASAGIEVTRPNLAASLRLAADVLRSPSFPASEFELVREEELAGIEESRSEPFQLAFTAFGRHRLEVPPEDVRYAATPDEEISRTKSATLDQVKSFHADFYGASDGMIVVLGDFDPKEVAPLVAELFGDWKNKKPFTRILTPYADRPSLVQSIEAPDKENAVLVAGVPLSLRDADPDYPALVLSNFMIGGGFLNSRLATRIRQKDGLSYHVSSSLAANAWDDGAWYTSLAIYAPQNAEKIRSALREELARVAADGFTADEVKNAKDGWLDRARLSRAMDRELAGTLAARADQGRTLTWDDGLEKRVASLTPEQVHAAIRKHANFEKLTIIQAGNFAGAASAGGGAPATPGTPVGQK